MNTDDARRLVSILNAAFPTPAMPDATFDLYVAEVTRLADQEAAVATIETIVRSAQWRPSIAEILETYRRTARGHAERRAAEARELAETHGLSAPRPEVPTQVVDWMKSKGIPWDEVLNDINDLERTA